MKRNIKQILVVTIGVIALISLTYFTFFKDVYNNNVSSLVTVDGKQMIFIEFMSNLDKQSKKKTAVQLNQLSKTSYDAELKVMVVDVEEDYSKGEYFLHGRIGKEVIFLYFPNTEENKETISKCLSASKGDVLTVEGKLLVSYYQGNETMLEMQNPKIK